MEKVAIGMRVVVAVAEGGRLNSKGKHVTLVILLTHKNDVVDLLCVFDQKGMLPLDSMCKDRVEYRLYRQAKRLGEDDDEASTAPWDEREE